MLQLPAILKDFNIYVDGSNFAGRAKSFKPPEVKVELESDRYAGMDGKISHDMGLETMEAVLTMAELAPELARLVGSLEECPIVCYGYAEVSPGGIGKPVQITMRGRVTSQDIGDMESGKRTDIKFGISCSAFKLAVDGQTGVDIDFLSVRRVIGGKDVLAQKKAALKM